MTALLPEIVPIFPLAQAILLPRGRLPLNIFEPRYLEMIDHALSTHRHIGMIQPMGAGPVPSLHAVGCLGRLTAWEETEDGRFHITLTGVARFRITEETPSGKMYRTVRADYSQYADDLTPSEDEPEIDRPALFAQLKKYLAGQKLEADWTAIAKTPAEPLVNSLSMICPFGAAEKQALVEAKTLDDRAAMLMALIEMAAAGSGSGGTRLQ
jgi:uncharacterized protein